MVINVNRWYNMNKPLIVCALPQETQTKLNVWAGAKYDLLYTKQSVSFQSLYAI